MNTYKEHEFVDLGLPSGTLWATCNVGADTPEGFGDYCSWDEGKTAAANWGEGWYMPTKEQWEELGQHTESTWETRNGVNGRLFVANNGNAIFLPAAGYRDGEWIVDENSYGDYWSGSPNIDHPGNTWYFDFSQNYYDLNDYHDCSIYSVRAVRSVR